MSMRCPNCGQVTQSTDCQCCHYPLTGTRAVRVKVAERASKKSVTKVTTWGISIVLAVILGGLALVYLSPGYRLLMVRSDSMKPVFCSGDMIITGPLRSPINGEIKPGTIVAFDRGDHLVTHRVVSMNGEALITKGDAAEEPDPWSITRSEVRGIYYFKIPYAGYALNFMRTKLGWFLVIILPTTLLVALIIKEIVKEALKNQRVVQPKGGDA